MDENRRRIDQVRDPEFTSDLDEVTLDELRQRRHLCDDLDSELSYYRRMLHGRMDLLAFEIRRRAGEETRSLIEALDEILADEVRAEDRSPAGRALPIETPDIPATGRRAVDRVLADDFLAHLPSLEDGELEAIQAALTEVETEVSEQRRAVYEAYETIHAELTRRYRDGLADIDSLLRTT
jgi:hypothetical protein